MCLFQSAAQSQHLHPDLGGSGSISVSELHTTFSSCRIPEEVTVCVRSLSAAAPKRSGRSESLCESVSQSCYSLKRTVGPALTESDRAEGPTSSRVSRDTPMINGLRNVPSLCANFLAHFSPPEPLQTLNLN